MGAINAGRARDGRVIDGTAKLAAEHADRSGDDEPPASHPIDQVQRRIKVDRAGALRITLRRAPRQGREMQHRIDAIVSQGGDHRWIGGITYTVMDASAAEVAAVIDNVESLRRVLPRTKRARVVGTASGGDQLLELVQGNALMEAEYTIRVRREPREARFWLDPTRPHGIDDAWGFFRYEPFIGPSGEERVLLTYGVLVDVGPGIVRDLFEERVRAALLSVPQLVRRQVAELRRPM